MDNDLKQSMLTYYDERASEYDEIYTLGTGFTAVSDPEAYKAETLRLKQAAGDVCRGSMIDIPCGTAFWMPGYANNCTSVLLVDQSENMLRESELRARHYNILDRCQFIQGDIFSIKLPHQAFDAAIVGFFISHLTQEEEQVFITNFRKSIKPGGNILILDSAWSTQRAKNRPKAGAQIRKLNNGKEFPIYKKYFDRQDIVNMGTMYEMNMEIHHFGKVFCAFSGQC